MTKSKRARHTQFLESPDSNGPNKATKKSQEFKYAKSSNKSPLKTFSKLLSKIYVHKPKNVRERLPEYNKCGQPYTHSRCVDPVLETPYSNKKPESYNDLENARDFYKYNNDQPMKYFHEQVLQRHNELRALHGYITSSKKLY